MYVKPTSPPDGGGRLRAGLVGLTLLVAACAAPDGAPESGPRQDDAKPTAQQAGDATAAGQKRGDGSAALAAGVQPAGGRKPRRFDPEEFVGYKPDALLPVLGAPDFVRRDGPAQIWQYRAENCVFDLFLYRDGDTSRVNHVELRERGATSEPAEACYARMRTERNPKPAG